MHPANATVRTNGLQNANQTVCGYLNKSTSWNANRKTDSRKAEPRPNKMSLPGIVISEASLVESGALYNVFVGIGWNEPALARGRYCWNSFPPLFAILFWRDFVHHPLGVICFVASARVYNCRGLPDRLKRKIRTHFRRSSLFGACLSTTDPETGFCFFGWYHKHFDGSTEKVERICNNVAKHEASQGKDRLTQ